MNGHNMSSKSAGINNLDENTGKRSPYRRFLDANNAMRAQQDPPDEALKQEKQVAIAECLVNYARTGDPVDFPCDMAFELAIEMHNIARRQTPALCKPVRGSGTPPLAYEAVDAIVALKRYVIASREGRVRDKRFIKTVLHHFGGSTAGGLNEDTVKAWVSDPRYEVKPSPIDDDPEMITLLMEKSGEYYRQFCLKATKWHGRAY